MKKLTGALFALVLFTLPAIAKQNPSTIDNDDTCDIAVAPAATLLLPYFEVGTDLPATKTTRFSMTNVTNADVVTRVTLWTDYSFPVLSFNVYLTGYDVQELDLYDIIVRGIIAPDTGTGYEFSPRGPYSDPSTQNNGQFCDRMPGALDDAYVNRMQSAFLEGVIPPLGIALPGCTTAGNVHENYVGYATIDVVGNCFFSGPHEPAYFTTDIRYDNVLTGEYQQIDVTTSTTQINPLVHIRAIAEGGTPESRVNEQNKSNFERTFYDRYAPAGYSDARQPLPATFAARWKQGGFLNHETAYKIWREGNTGAGATCAAYATNANLPVREVVVFDEAENPVVGGNLTLPETSLLHMNDAAMPQPPNGATGGWTYLNLDTVAGDGEATQNWVVVSMQSTFGGGDFDATPLGNGCTPERGVSEVSQAGGDPIGPAPNEN